MEHFLFIGEIDENKKDSYIKFHKEMPLHFLKEKKTLGEEKELVWITGNKIFAYFKVKDFKEYMDKITETDIGKKWFEQFDGMLKGQWQKVDKFFDFEEQMEIAL